MRHRSTIARCAKKGDSNELHSLSFSGEMDVCVLLPIFPLPASLFRPEISLRLWAGRCFSWARKKKPGQSSSFALRFLFFLCPTLFLLLLFALAPNSQVPRGGRGVEWRGRENIVALSLSLLSLSSPPRAFHSPFHEAACGGRRRGREGREASDK